MSAKLRTILNGNSGELLCLVAGALLTPAFAPFALWPTALLSLALLFVVIDGNHSSRGLLRGWLFGAGLFGSGASWIYVSIHTYGAASPVLAAALTAIFCLTLALFCALPVWVYLRWFGNSRSKSLAFAALWTLCEMLRSWVLTGFPWLLTGTSQIDAPLQGYFPLLGVHGVSLVLVFTAATIAQSWRKQWPSLAALVLIWLSGPLLNNIDWTIAAKAPVQITLVQSNIPQQIKWQRSELQKILDIHADLSETAWGSDIIVWPEAAIPTLSQNVQPFLNMLDARARATGSTLITGIPVMRTDGAGERKTFNSVLALGSGEGVYHKRRLVPFGEYVPFEDWLRGLIAFFDLPMSSFSRGPADQSLIRAGDLKVTAAICYEIVFPDLIAKNVKNSGLLLTVSNDTWFGASIGPLQHLEMARVRAIENRRPLARGTNNGISALIGRRGIIIVQGQQFSRELIQGELTPSYGLTPFSRWGSVPVLIACILCLALTRHR